MATITETIYKCDCCSRQSKDKDFRDGNSAGRLDIEIKGSYSACSYDGSWGGINIKDKIEVCFLCSKKIRNFISSITK